MKKIFFLMLTLCISAILYSQTEEFPYYRLYVKGQSTLHNFKVEQVFTIAKKGGNWCQNFVYSLRFPTFYGSGQSVINNTQYNYGYSVEVPASFNKVIIEEVDKYGNDWLKISIQVPNTYVNSSFDVKIEHELREGLNLDINNPSDPFPLVDIPQIISSTIFNQRT